MKRILLIFSILFCFQSVFSQGMSDKEIVDLISREQKIGTSQNEIAAKLLQSGVSPDRLKMIKNDYDMANTLPDEETDVERQRDEVQIVPEEKSEKSIVYGRDIFNNKLLTFEPAMNMPTPADYVLGTGDQIIVDIWGASQTLIEKTISPDGYVVITGVGPVYLAGKTVEAAKGHLKSVLKGVYADSKINLSVGKLRSIQIQVVGEVWAPGNYTLSSLSTVFNALYAAGGIGSLGTLRAIKVYRGGKEVAVIDVYDFIFNGSLEGNIRLQDNDVISVGTFDALVSVVGEVKRPMVYELKSSETLSSLINYSGGFSNKAYTGQMRVTRKSGREYSLFTVGKDDMGTFTMHDGDEVQIDAVTPRFSNMIEISGAVFYPGQYELGNGVTTVRELLDAAGGLREDAFLNRAVLHHRNYDKTIDAKSIDIKGILDGSVPDVTLRNNDALFIPSKSDMDGNRVLKIMGQVRIPGVYSFAENTTIEDLILQAGGLTNLASTNKIDVIRYIYDPEATEESEKNAEVFSFELKDGFIVDNGERFVLQPYDEVYVHRSPVSREIESVSIEGSVNFAGHYAMQKKNYRLSDLVKAAGGLSKSAYVKGAYMVRKMSEEELLQREMMRKKSQIELYEEILRSDKDVNVAILDEIYAKNIDEREYYNLAIDLEKALAEPGGEFDVVLRKGDEITIPEYNSTVKISGEVMHPTTMSWQKGKNLGYYIDHAGGYSNKAKKKGVYVINMNGSVEKVSKYSSKAIQPGCEIVIPRKSDNRFTTSDLVALGTSSMSFVTLIVALINLLK